MSGLGDVAPMSKVAILDKSAVPNTVGQIMASPVVTVTPDTKVGDAVYLMKTKNIGSVVVIGSEQSVGIVTERDLLLELAASPYTVYAPVSSIMSKPVISCSPIATIFNAFVTMDEKKIRRLPVIQNNRLVGIVTERDLIRWMFRLIRYPQIKLA